ncbi:MAG: HD-GYP domain-containing protein, partial [Lachnospira sp.]|nr:HD-GYP domain-containing protein [Lachnospira sp.]
MSDNNSSSNNIHTKTVFIFDADDGMTLSKDVLNSDGSLIAASGTKLDMDMIAKISANHILEIEIIDKDYTEPVRPVENDNSTYYEKVRNSKEFKAFCKEYNEGISDLKSQLNDIVNRNADVDVDELLTYPLSLMNTYSNKLQMFDMLHSLRQFDDLTYAHSVNVALVAS